MKSIRGAAFWLILGPIFSLQAHPALAFDFKFLQGKWVITQIAGNGLG